MATYHSTRSRTAQPSAKEAIRRGIAPDGGLYVSDELGQSKIDLEGLANKDYFELAREVLGTPAAGLHRRRDRGVRGRGLRQHLRL